MAYIKLTIGLRNKILAHVVASCTKTMAEELDLKSKKFAQMCYNTIYPPELVVRMRTFPEDFWHTRNSIEIKEPGRKWSNSFALEVPSLFAAKHAHCPTVTLAEHPELLEQFKQLASEKDVCDNYKSSLRNEVEALLYSCTTYNQLKEQWPDGEVYYGQFFKQITEASAAKKHLPAKPLDTLRELIAMGVQS